MFAEIPLDMITLGERFRKELGDLTALTASIELLGLLHPIVITTEHRLVVGRRRLAAYAQLGRETIPAQVVDLDDPLKAELDENECRKPFLPSERVALSYAIEERERQKAKERQRIAGPSVGPGKKKSASGKFPEALEDQGQTRDLVADKLGWSAPTLAKARAVVKAAEEEPEDADLQKLVTKMDQTGNVSAAYSALPEYAKPPETSKPPKPFKPLPCSALLEKIDHALQPLLPHVRFLDDEDRDNLRALLRYYLEAIDHADEMGGDNDEC